MTLVCKSVGICDCIVNPIYGCRVKMTQFINPIYAGLERSCPRDSINIQGDHKRRTLSKCLLLS